ncbi:MAG: Bifunctional protein HldE [Chlamydiales bacterium]|nr:Bifunctional protein HldE [Chlamydiales bacterium]MCH9635451.1 Bifunctional protein HldE [Chlamydiales bacterium]
MPSLPCSDLESWHSNKIIDPKDLDSLLPEIRRGKRLATLNGSFDLLHAGHLYMLFEAAKVADILLILVNSDASVRAYKDKSRPIIPLRQRMEMLGALAFVDFVTSFEETDPRAILQKIGPDVHVNGVEYGENCIEAEIIKQMGAELHLVDRIPGLATSSIIDRIEACASLAK